MRRLCLAYALTLALGCDSGHDLPPLVDAAGDAGGDVDGAPDAAAGVDGAAAGVGAGLIIGGLDRMIVFRQVEGRCLQLRLVNPGGGTSPLPAINTPVGWKTEAGVAALQETCDATPIAATDDATGGTGVITFGATGDGGFPCSLDVSVTLQFDWGEATLDGTDVPVEGVTGC